MAHDVTKCHVDLRTKFPFQIDLVFGFGDAYFGFGFLRYLKILNFLSCKLRYF